VNDGGDVVGRANFSPTSTNRHAFLWKKGKMTDLGVAAGWPCSTAEAINSQGQVIIDTGICGVGGGPALLWENGGPSVELNSLVVPGSGLTVGDVAYINDRGEITAVGVLLNGDQHAVLLVPDGICDDTCEAGVAASQNSAIFAPNVPTMMRASESSLSPVEKFRNQMRQRYHMPGQPTAPRN
jgi:probable HAF family extracellular repeat protein